MRSNLLIQFCAPVCKVFKFFSPKTSQLLSLVLCNFEFILYLFHPQALELKPTEKNALVARSRCHLQLGDTESALKDAETALEDDKEFIRVSIQSVQNKISFCFLEFTKKSIDRQ